MKFKINKSIGFGLLVAIALIMMLGVAISGQTDMPLWYGISIAGNIVFGAWWILLLFTPAKE